MSSQRASYLCHKYLTEQVWAFHSALCDLPRWEETHCYTKTQPQEREVQRGAVTRYSPNEDTLKQDDHVEQPRAGQGPQRGDSALQKN